MRALAGCVKAGPPPPAKEQKQSDRAGDQDEDHSVHMTPLDLDAMSNRQWWGGLKASSVTSPNAAPMTIKRAASIRRSCGCSPARSHATLGCSSHGKDVAAPASVSPWPRQTGADRRRHGADMRNPRPALSRPVSRVTKSNGQSPMSWREHGQRATPVGGWRRRPRVDAGWAEVPPSAAAARSSRPSCRWYPSTAAATRMSVPRRS